MGIKADHLKEILQGYGSLAVAFSGGVDSTFLLLAAKEALGDQLLALTASGPAFLREEQEETKVFCLKHGIRQLRIPFTLAEMEGLAENGPDRCYHCKGSLFRRLLSVAEEEGFPFVADGTNADDLSDYRPGIRALAELGVESPLLKAEFSKEEIRQELKDRGIEIWAKPAYACLATRVPTGEPVTEEKLRAVDLVETELRKLGFAQVRVRHHGDVARIEASRSDLPRFLEEGMPELVAERVCGAGFRYVALDLLGYRVGNMNTSSQQASRPTEGIDG